MKISILITMVVVSLCASCSKDDNPTNPYSSVTISMEANSASDVYYSLAAGQVSTVNRSDWDIAFSVPLQTATILTNEGAGIELYCIGDTGDWSSVDENSIPWQMPRYNDKSDWSVGALNQNASGFPNYGWGTYHFGNPDHNVGGDSLYVIKIADGSLKKLMIRAKLGATGSSIIRWANLDGTHESVVSVPTADYVNSKHFVHYSLVNKEIIEVEPDKNAWDLLFTRYVVRITAGPGVFIYHAVMGILSNQNVTVAKVAGVAPQNAMESDAPDGYSNAADAIGYDWKVSDPITHEISLVDNTSYFIQSVDGTKYQLYFTNYGGNTAGTLSFKVKTVE